MTCLPLYIRQPRQASLLHRSIHYKVPHVNDRCSAVAAMADERVLRSASSGARHIPHATSCCVPRCGVRCMSGGKRRVWRGSLCLVSGVTRHVEVEYSRGLLGSVQSRGDRDVSGSCQVFQYVCTRAPCHGRGAHGLIVWKCRSVELMACRGCRMDVRMDDGEIQSQRSIQRTA
jgi:hypothetical protein